MYIPEFQIEKYRKTLSKDAGNKTKQNVQVQRL